MLNNKWLVCAVITVAAVSTGCAGKKTTSTPDSAPVTPTTPSTGSVATTPTDTGSGSASSSTPAAAQSIIYFDYDSSDMKPESQSVVDAWARYLSGNPTAKAQLQGNTDERGTREYNIALGERRAQTVGAALQAAGVAAGQLELTSNGEEKPVVVGSDESAWSQNRRVEIVGQ